MHVTQRTWTTTDGWVPREQPAEPATAAIAEARNVGRAESREAGTRLARALVISCVGRKLVLEQCVEEELEAVRDGVGPGTVLAGFSSYGEISPFAPGAPCTLHNQTMTVTTLREA